MSEAKHYCPEKLKPGGCTLHNLHCGYPACDRAPASPLPEVAEPVAKLIGWRTDDYLMETNDPKLARNWEPHHKLLPIFAGDPNTKLAAPSPVAQAPAQAGEVGAFEDWWYGHDGVRQRQVAYLGWPCTKELAESIWNGAREQAASSLPVALQQAREALAYHQAQTRPIDKTVDAIKAIDAALATQPLAAPVQQEAEAVRLLTDAKAALQLINKRSDHYWRKVDRSLDAALERLATPPAHPVLAPVVREPLWQPMASAPRDRTLLAKVDGAVRMIRWGKTSHVSLYGFCLADQGPEDFDLCKPDGWMELPAIQATTGEQSHG